MHYDFPVIKNIDDVLPYIKDSDDFIVAEKDGYTVINYYSMSSDTFRPLTGDPETDYQSKIRRECRGIIFNKQTGRISRRPYHKFFNAGEREETLVENLDLESSHNILTKLDGSMIVPFIIQKRMIWGTKMGKTDLSEQVHDFIYADEYHYHDFAFEMIWKGYSPIFEWCSNKNRIVIEHLNDQLILTGIRHISSGEYVPYQEMIGLADSHDIPVVDAYQGNANNMETLVANTREEVGNEGYVVRWNNGHMSKVKSDWYVAIHKAKDKLLYERNVVDMILNNHLDDVMPYLLEDDKNRLMKYQDIVMSDIINMTKVMSLKAWELVYERTMTRKDFAIEYSGYFGPFKSIIFSRYDDLQNGFFEDYHEWFDHMEMKVIDVILNNCISNTKFEKFKQQFGVDWKW